MQGNNILSSQHLLNACFDDIEKFVSRLQQAAEAYKELERRRKDRNNKKSKNNRTTGGILVHVFYYILGVSLCSEIFEVHSST